MKLPLIITNNCNFSCKTCLREYERGSNLSIDVLAKLLPQVKAFGYDYIAFTGGEPCLHQQFEDLVKLVVQKGFKFSFVSNGSLLEKYIFIVNKYPKNLHAANFSLDGATAKTHDFIRMKGSFYKVKQAVYYFVSKKIKTNTIMCLNKININEIEGVVKLSSKLGVSKVRFAGTIKTKYNKKIVLNDKERYICLLRIGNLIPKYKMKLSITSSLQTRRGVAFCKHFQNLSSLSVNPKGELIFCCDTIGFGTTLGSLKEKSFSELFRSYVKAVNLLKKIRSKMLTSCKTIPGFNTCEFCNYFVPRLTKKVIPQISHELLTTQESV